MSNNQSDPGFVFGQIPTPAQWNSYFAGKQDANTPQTASLSITLGASGDYGYTGTGGHVWTLPSLATQTSPFDIKNLGTGLLTLACSGSDKLFTSEATASIAINPGDSYHIVNFSSVWAVE